MNAMKLWKTFENHVWITKQLNVLWEMYQPRSEKEMKQKYQTLTAWDGKLFGRCNCPLASADMYGTGLSVLDLSLGFVWWLLWISHNLFYQGVKMGFGQTVRETSHPCLGEGWITCHELASHARGLKILPLGSHHLK